VDLVNAHLTFIRPVAASVAAALLRRVYQAAEAVGGVVVFGWVAALLVAVQTALLGPIPGRGSGTAVLISRIVFRTATLHLITQNACESAAFPLTAATLISIRVAIPVLTPHIACGAAVVVYAYLPDSTALVVAAGCVRITAFFGVLTALPVRVAAEVVAFCFGRITWGGGWTRRRRIGGTIGGGI